MLRPLVWSCLAVHGYGYYIKRNESLLTSYDFIVVGGGASGLTVADRLSENPKTSVLVLEYGPFDQKEPPVLVPGLLDLAASPYKFNLTTAPHKHLKNATFDLPVGAAVGGSTILNGMFLDRGGATDYDLWAELGNPGWGWNDLLPYFKKSENFTPADSEFAREFEISWDTNVHGSGGPVQASYPVFQWQIIKHFFRAWHGIGVSTPKDPSAGIKSGVFWATSSLDPKDETRSYARTAHWDRVQPRPNYHLKAYSTVQKVLFNGKTATGVEYVDRETGQTHKIHAKKEVVIAAGAAHTPQLLQLTGIGPKKLLDSVGVKTVVDLPGVGQNFQDHPTIYPVFNFQTQPFPNINFLTENETYAQEQLELYWSERKGPYTITHHSGNTVAFVPLPNITDSSQSILDLANAQSLEKLYPDADPTVLKGYAAQRKLFLRQYKSTEVPIQETGWNGSPTLPVTVVKPLSRGSINIVDDKITTQPRIDFGTLTEPSDLELIIAALRVNRRMIADPAMQELNPVEVFPGANITTDEQLREFLPGIIQPTYYHLCCTASMLPLELGGVLGPDLRVHGTRGLSVVDASLIPLLPATHPSGTVYAVAEKAADIIKARHNL